MIAKKYGEKYNEFCNGSLARSQVITHVHSARRSQREPANIPARTSGREQPSGPASGRQSAPNRGVAHAPAPSVTSPKCVPCAAQNAALVVLPLSSQVVSVERLARGALAATGLSTTDFDGQLRAPEVRQPPLFVAAPLAASAVPIRKPGPVGKERREIHQFSRRLRVEFTAASTGLTLLARVANTL